MENNHGETNCAAPLELLFQNEAVAICEKLESAFRHKGDECHNNQGSRTLEDWERMDRFLVASADDIKKVKQDVKNLADTYSMHESKKACMSNDAVFGNAAAMREALSDACYAMFNFLRTQNGGYEEMANALDKAKAALSAPPRQCEMGTADEQYRRHDAFCKAMRNEMSGYHCEDAPRCVLCFSKWAQMPYEAEKGGQS